MNSYTIALLTLSAVCAAAGQVLFKIGAVGRVTLADYINLPIAVGVILYGIGTLIWIYTLSFEKLVNVYSFTVLTFLLVYLAGFFFIKETISYHGFVGICLILGGLYLITHQSS